MKIQRRAGRPSSVEDRSTSANGNGAENGAYLDDNGAEDAYDDFDGTDDVEAIETHVQANGTNVVNGSKSTNGSNGTNGTKKAIRANGSATDAPTLTNGSDTASETVTTTTVIAPTLPKRRRGVVSSPTEVMARPMPDRAEIPSRRDAKTTVAPVEVVAPAPKEPLAPWRLIVTYENVFWVAIFALTIATRFWDLGTRGIHHDESLHAHFSDVLYSGGGYIHDPMMHGPIQFHLIAFMYWLFGATDATARFASVFCGIWVVMSPFFLRKQMGRVPAMVCTFLLFISPSILYFSRMAREDAIFSAMEMIMLVGLWRFVSMRKPADFILFMAGFALMFTIKETSFLTLGIVGIFLFAVFAYQAGYAILAALGGYIVAAGGLFMYINAGMKAGTIVGLPNIANPGPDTNIIMTFAMKFLGHPVFYGEVALFVLFIVAVSVLMSMQRSALSGSLVSDAVPSRVRLRPAMAGTGAGNGAGGGIPSRTARPVSSGSSSIPTNGHTDVEVRENVVIADSAIEEAPADYIADEAMDAQEVWDPSRMEPKPGSVLGRYQPGSLPYLLGALFSRPKIIVIGALVATTIFFTFYTVFFTDIPHGIVSGLFASLGYWMGQQDQKRGGQPWFYYLILIPIYEPIAIFFSLAGTIFFSWRGVRWLVRRKRGYDDAPDAYESRLGMFNTGRPVPLTSMKSFLPLFLIWWLVGTFVIYSWAGEKMPWLSMHMARPAIFLSALFIGALLVSLAKRRSERLAAEGVAGAANDIAPGVPVNVPATGTNGVPSRRRTSSAARVAQPVYLSAQDPPWVTWSKPGSHFPIAAFLTLFVVLVVGWGLLMNALSYKAKSDPTNFATYSAWGWTWAYPLIILALVVAYAFWVGPARSLRYLGLGILTVGLMYQFRSAVDLAYNEPDVSTELASYVQTSPDVTRVMGEIKTFADYNTTGKEARGGTDTKIMYDSFTSWPMEWYLRDYNKIFIAEGAVQPAADVPILLLEYNKHKDNLNFLPNYVAQRYAMRWWFPEEWYKNDFLPHQYLTVKDANGQDQPAYRSIAGNVFSDGKGGYMFLDGTPAKDSAGNAITPLKDSAGNTIRAEEPPTSQIGEALHTVGVTLTEPKFEATMWKYLIFRETPQPLGSEDMVLYLRRDIAQVYHRLQYDLPDSTDIP